LCAWYAVNNPERDVLAEDLNINVSGVLTLTAAEVRRLASEAGGLLPVNANVMDEDWLFDDTVYKNPTPFMLGVPDTNPTQFTFPIIVPHGDLTASETGSEEFAEIYCKVVAEHKLGNQTIFVARRNTDKQNVRIRPPS
jgi:hypothetical protein